MLLSLSLNSYRSLRGATLGSRGPVAYEVDCGVGGGGGWFATLRTSCQIECIVLPMHAEDRLKVIGNDVCALVNRYNKRFSKSTRFHRIDFRQHNINNNIMILRVIINDQPFTFGNIPTALCVWLNSENLRHRRRAWLMCGFAEHSAVRRRPLILRAAATITAISCCVAAVDYKLVDGRTRPIPNNNPMWGDVSGWWWPTEANIINWCFDEKCWNIEKSFSFQVWWTNG